MKDEKFGDFVRRVSNFNTLSPTEKICHAAWYLHAHGHQFVTASTINALFDEIHAVAPHTSVYLKRLSDRRPPLFLRSKSGFRLESAPRQALDEKLSAEPETALISALLASLTDRLTSPEEARFLDETLRCYSVRAFRAAIVMAWNLAYDHLQRWIFKDPERVARFNISLATKYKKMDLQIKDIEDMADLKEFQAIECAVHAKLINKNVGDILKEKLKRRNAAAHPSNVVITQSQVDDVITDLVNNIVLRLV